MKSINVGVVGCGAVAEIFHLPVLKRTSSFNIKTVVDLDLQRVTKLKKELGIDFNICKDYREVLDDDDIEAVLITTPPHLHAEMILEAFEKQKDVLCEKPLSLNVNDAKEVISRMKETNRILVLGYHFRFLPQFKKLKEVSSKLGDIIGVQSTFCSNAYAWPTRTKFKTQLEKGGGVLTEMGTHHIDLISWILGKPKQVWASLGKMTNKSPVIDKANVFIIFENDTTANINLGWRNYTVNYLNVFGTQGHAYTEHEKARVYLHLNNLVAQPPIISKSKIIGSPYQEEWLYFKKCVETRKNPLFTSQSLINPVAIVEKAQESADKNKVLLEIGDIDVQ